MSDPKFTEVDLTMLRDDGVLMAANEAFFWPLGLALAWTQEGDGPATDLHVREWRFDDGHHEAIELAPDDEIAPERRQRFAAFVATRDLREEPK